VHGLEVDEGDEREGAEKARSPAASMPRTPSLAGSSPAGGEKVLPGAAASSTALLGAFPFPATSTASSPPLGPLSSARRPTTSCATTTSPHPSSSSSRSSIRSHTARPSSSSSISPPPPPTEHWHAPWAPPTGLDDEEQLVLGLLPILHPGAGLLQPEPAHNDGDDDQRRGGALLLSGSSEREWAVEREWALGPLVPGRAAPAHPFSVPGIAIRHSLSPPSSTSTGRALPASAAQALLAPAPEPEQTKRAKRTSMLSTLAAPFAGLGRSRSTGGASGEGERARAYRLSVIGEASSGAQSGASAASSASSSASSLAHASASSSRRRLRRTSVSSSSRAGADRSSSQSVPSGGDAASTETSTGSQVRYASAEAAREELEGMNGKAAKLLGLSVAAAGRGGGEEEERAAGRFGVGTVERSGSVRSSRSRGVEEVGRELPRWPARRDEVEPFELSVRLCFLSPGVAAAASGFEHRFAV